MKCPHGCEIGAQAAVDDIASWSNVGDGSGVLEFYSACDCCDFLMHKSHANTTDSDDGYQVCEDGRTLCHNCRETTAG
jgi:hypothetical protein